MRFLLAFAIAAGFAAPAAACINDAELRTHEREFRSQYNGEPAPAPEVESPEPTGHHWALGGGVVLLMGAVAMTVTNRRSAN